MFTISSGHYGPRTGAHGLIDEGTENIRVAKEVFEILRASNIVAHYIEDKTSKSASQNIGWLVAQHNKTSREIDVSIHFNSVAGTHSRGIGTEVLYVNPAVKALAEQMSTAISAAGNFKNRGAKHRDNLGFLNGTAKKAILIEVCFVNDSIDVALYKENFTSICHAIASELAKTVGKSIAASIKKEESPVVKVIDEKHAVPAEWAKEAVEWATSKEVSISDGTYLKKPMTREEAITMLHRFSKLK